MKIFPLSRENRILLGIFTVVSVAAFLVFHLTLRHSLFFQSSSETAETSGVEEKEMAGSDSSSGEADEAVVFIDLLPDGAYPDAITVPLGSSVQFNTKDGKKHSMSQGAGSQYEHTHDHREESLDSGVFGEGEAYKVDFKEVGTYYFHDHLNAKLGVTVIVYEEEKK